MPEARLKSEVRVQAWIRRCSAIGLMTTVVRRGDADAGALFLKINHFGGGCEVFSGVTSPTGAPAWMRVIGQDAVPEKEADAYLSRQAKYDADCWIVEIEDPKGIFSLDEPVLSS